MVLSRSLIESVTLICAEDGLQFLCCLVILIVMDNQGNKITIFDNFSNSSNTNLVDPNIKIIDGDILDY